MPSAIVALAGRRIDAPDADPSRFPLAHADAVRERIRARLLERDADTLMSSAACGADLLALDAAGELGIRRIVVLPFDRKRFRDISVTDRPGGDQRWGPLFDRVLAEIPATDVITLVGNGEGTAAFAAANERILEDAGRLGASTDHDVVAAIVWDGAPRGKDDLTAHFAEAARRRGFTVGEIPTR
jgi:hypothetical protein